MKSQSLVLCCTFISTCVLFVGCCKNPDIVYVDTDCPRFTKTADIKIERLDSDYAKIKWVDVQKLKDLSVAKDKFNKDISAKNEANRIKLKNALRPID